MTFPCLSLIHIFIDEITLEHGRKYVNKIVIVAEDVPDNVNVSLNLSFHDAVEIIGV